MKSHKNQSFCLSQTNQGCVSCPSNQIELDALIADRESAIKFLLEHELIAEKIPCPTCSEWAELDGNQFRCTRTKEDFVNG